MQICESYDDITGSRKINYSWTYIDTSVSIIIYKKLLFQYSFSSTMRWMLEINFYVTGKDKMLFKSLCNVSVHFHFPALQVSTQFLNFSEHFMPLHSFGIGLSGAFLHGWEHLWYASAHVRRHLTFPSTSRTTKLTKTTRRAYLS